MRGDSNSHSSSSRTLLSQDALLLRRWQVASGLAVASRPTLRSAMSAYGCIFAALSKRDLPPEEVARAKHWFLNRCVAERGTARPTKAVFAYADRTSAVCNQTPLLAVVSQRAILVRLRRVMNQLLVLLHDDLDRWPTHVLAQIVSQSLDCSPRTVSIDAVEASDSLVLAQQDVFTVSLAIAEHMKRFGRASVDMDVLQSLYCAWQRRKLTALTLPPFLKRQRPPVAR